MLAEFYSCIQNPKESVKEFGESILQIARKIMMAKPEFKVDIDNTLKAGPKNIGTQCQTS